MENSVTDRQVFERYLTDAEVSQLLRTIDRSAGHLAARDSAWIRLLLYTGIRVGTLAAMTVDDATVAVQGRHLLVRPEAAKGGRGYRIHVSSKAVRALQDLLRIRRQMEPCAGCNALVLARTGEPMSVRSFQARMREWVSAAKLTAQASPHWLRHTLAKRVIHRSESSDPLAIAQIALGHARRATTTIYTLPDREEIARAMEAAS